MPRATQFVEPDLTGIIERAASDWKWPKNKPNVSANAKMWYVAFLHVVYNSPGGRCFIVTDEADDLWHTHMTFSVRYRQWCESILGFYLDHTPALHDVQATQADADAATAAYSQVLPSAGQIQPDLIKPCW